STRTSTPAHGHCTHRAVHALPPRRSSDLRARTPLLISYALVNRPYVVDLQRDRSLVKGLLARGEDVYIIDWGYPDRSDRFLTLQIGRAHLNSSHVKNSYAGLCSKTTIHPR